MLLDQFAPRPDFVETHSVDVPVSAEEAYRAVWTTDFGTSPLLRTLLFLRTLPHRLMGHDSPMRAGPAITLQTAIDKGFGLLAEAPGREVVLGLVGRFWRPLRNVEPFRREYFTDQLPAGLAKVVWNFAVVGNGGPGERVRVTTETRVACADRASTLKFGLYWGLARPFNGLTRLQILRAIQRACVGKAVARGMAVA